MQKCIFKLYQRSNGFVGMLALGLMKRNSAARSALDLHCFKDGGII